MKAEDRLKELIESGEINSLDGAKQEGFIKGWNEALRIHDVVVPKGTLCRCECEMPDIDGRKGLCGRCERPIIV